jgi:hypothetical protein
MTLPGEIAMWRAPTRRCGDPLGEVQNGFAAADYPGNGLYFATFKPIADSFQFHYRNGLQEFFMPQIEFDALVLKSVIMPDKLYPDGQCWYVPPVGLAEFNACTQLGSPGHYYPQP